MTPGAILPPVWTRRMQPDGRDTLTVDRAAPILLIANDLLPGVDPQFCEVGENTVRFKCANADLTYVFVEQCDNAPVSRYAFKEGWWKPENEVES